jgi:ketosteroid isomerase-like protein
VIRVKKFTDSKKVIHSYPAIKVSSLRKLLATLLFVIYLINIKPTDMKKGFFALAALTILFSCNDDTKVAGSNDENNAAMTNSQHIQDVYRAIETGDVSKIDSLLTDDVVDHNANPDGSDMRGKDSVLKMLGQIHTYFDGLKMEYMSDATSSDGTYQFALVRMTGKAKANPWGMPVGMDIDDTSVDVIKLRDGKATDHWGFMSMKDMQEMMHGMQGGNMPAPGMKDTATKK